MVDFNGEINVLESGSSPNNNNAFWKRNVSERNVDTVGKGESTKDVVYKWCCNAVDLQFVLWQHGSTLRVVSRTYLLCLCGATLRSSECSVGQRLIGWHTSHEAEFLNFGVDQ